MNSAATRSDLTLETSVAERDHVSLAMLDRLQAELQSCAGLPHADAEAGVRRLEPAFADALPRGTSVVVDLTTCGFVQARTRTEALKLFIGRFGLEARGWAFEVGMPMKIGASHCLK